MNPSRRMAALAYGCLLLLLTFGIEVPRGVAGQIMSGIYKVTQTADLGAQVRVTRLDLNQSCADNGRPAPREVNE